MTEKQRHTFVPDFDEGLDAVIKLLSKAAPLTDLYLYLRDHPAKAKFHRESGFISLGLAVKAYLDVSYQLFPLISVFIYYSCPKKCKHLFM